MKPLFIVALVIMMGCKKSDNSSSIISTDLPDCIKENINYYKNNPNSYVNEIDEYLFQGKLVYTFSQDYKVVSDAGTTIINSDCSYLCFIGGFAGIRTCNGDNFSQKAVLQRVIWKR